MSVRQPNNSPPRASAYSSGKCSLVLEIIKEHIQYWVGENDLMRSSTLLSELAKMYAPNQIKEAAIIRRGIVEVEKIGRMNVGDFEHLSRERNRLGLAILDLVETFCVL